MHTNTMFYRAKHERSTASAYAHIKQTSCTRGREMDPTRVQHVARVRRRTYQQVSSRPTSLLRPPLPTWALHVQCRTWRDGHRRVRRVVPTLVLARAPLPAPPRRPEVPREPCRGRRYRARRTQRVWGLEVVRFFTCGHHGLQRLEVWEAQKRARDIR